MSFILDALRKSETDRRRAAEPILAGVPVTPGRTGAPGWVWVVIGSLAVAVIVLGWAWWRSIDQTMRDAAVATVPSGPVTTPAGSAGNGPAANASLAESSAARETGAGGGSGPGQLAGPSNSAAPLAGSGSGNSGAADSASTLGTGSDDVAAAARVPAGPIGAARIPGDGAPGASTEPAGGNGAPPRARQDAASAGRSALPTLTDIEAAGVTVPPLNLELHVYHSDPARRWVYINGSRYSEGRRLESGPSVVEIVPEGVVLSYQGRDFLLLAQ